MAAKLHISTPDKTLDEDQRRVQQWFEDSHGSLFLQGWANPQQMQWSVFIHQVIKHLHEWRTPLSSSYALCERTCGIQQLARNILGILPANMVEEFSVRDKHRKRQGLNWMCSQLAKRAWQWEQQRRKLVYQAEMRNKLERPPLNLAWTDSRQVVSTQQIFVKCSDDCNKSSTKVLRISRQATVAEVCYEVYKLTGVNLASFNIRFAGKYLEMDTPICHYGVGPDSTIHMHLKGLKGGGRTDNSCVHAAQA